MNEKIRTFISIEIPDFINKNISKWINIHFKDSKIKFVKEENRHLTLKFIGDIESNKIDRVKNAVLLSIAAIKNQIIKLEVKNLGFFPNMNKPKILWVGIENLEDNLCHIFNQLEINLVKIGIPKENRSFNPHITISRLKNKLSNNEIEIYKKFGMNNFGIFEAKRIIIYKSELRKTGAVYTPIDVFEL